MLIEAKSIQSKVDFVIAGIGININSEKGEIPDCATSLYLETAKNYNIDELFRKFTTEAITLYKEFKKANIKMLLDALDSDLKQRVLGMNESDINEVVVLR